MKFTTCDVCKNAIVNSVKFSNQPAAALLNRSIEGQTNNLLMHPNIHFLKLIKSLDQLFVKNTNSMHVFEDVLNAAVDTKLFTFPCENHMSVILPQIVQMFIQLRMQRHCKMLNSKDDKLNRHTKKTAKFCTT